MARINIDDSFISDPRFRAIVRLIGNEDTAIGAAYRMFRLAQKYWGDGKKLIPENLFCTIENLHEFILVDLAELREGGVYVRGSEEQFDWFLERKEAAKEGGRRSAEIRKRKYGTAVPENARNRSKTEAPTEAKPKHPPKPLAPALALTPSLKGDTRARVESPPGNKIEDLAVLGVTEVVSAIHTVGRDTNAAQQAVDPIVWKILSKKYPSNTWGNIVSLYEQAAKRNSTAFFEKDLRGLFQALIPTLGVRHGLDPPLPPESA